MMKDYMYVLKENNENKLLILSYLNEKYINESKELDIVNNEHDKIMRTKAMLLEKTKSSKNFKEILKEIYKRINDKGDQELLEMMTAIILWKTMEKEKISINIIATVSRMNEKEIRKIAKEVS